MAPKQTLQKIRNINEEETDETQETAEETIKPDSTRYIREMMEDRQNINFIQSVKFRDEKVTEINKTKRGEFRIQTKINSKQTYWLVETGRPTSFMKIETARNLLVNETTKIKQPEKSIGEFRCFNNSKINIQGTIQVDVKTGSSMAKKLHNTTSQHQHNKHTRKRHNGQIGTTLSNVVTRKQRWDTIT